MSAPSDALDFGTVRTGDQSRSGGDGLLGRGMPDTESKKHSTVFGAKPSGCRGRGKRVEAMDGP